MVIFAHFELEKLKKGENGHFCTLRAGEARKCRKWSFLHTLSWRSLKMPRMVIFHGLTPKNVENSQKCRVKARKHQKVYFDQGKACKCLKLLKMIESA